MTTEERKAANRASSNKWRLANPGREKAWRLANPDKVKEYRRTERFLANKRRAYQRWRLANPEKHNAKNKGQNLRRKEALAGRPRPDACEICGDTEKQICWDHCHNSGAFRGWICSPCNTALGMVRDSPHRLRALIAYLEENDSTLRAAA